MKRNSTALALALSLGLSAPLAHASADGGASRLSARRSGSSAGNLGLGVMLGEPTGVTLKYWTSGESALAFGAGYAFNDYFAFQADYLYHFTRAFSGSGSQFVPYLGVGAALFAGPAGRYWAYDRLGRAYYSSSGFGAGLRVPFGLEFRPRATPLGVFADLVPGFGFVPFAYGFFQGVLGVRFYI